MFPFDRLRFGRSEVDENHDLIPDNEIVPSEKLKVALLLGGGGTHVIKTVGTLQVLMDMWEKERIPYEIIMTGASAGSLLGASIALKGKQILKNHEHLRRATDLFEMNPQRNEIFDSNVLREGIKHYVGESTTFEDCLKDVTAHGEAKAPVDLYISVMDLDRHEPILLHKGNYQGPLYLAVDASCAIPGIFKPRYLKYDKGYYSFVEAAEHEKNLNVYAIGDGGFTADIPLKSLHKHRPDIDIPIAIRVAPGTALLEHGGAITSSVLEAVRRVYKLEERLTPDSVKDYVRDLLRVSDDSIPASISRTLFSIAVGSDIIPAHVRKSLISIYPRHEGIISPIKALGKEDFETLIKAGELAAHEANAVQKITHRLKTHKKKKAQSKAA